MPEKNLKIPGVWKTYDNSSGLLAGVGTIAQDAEGYMWFGTFGGGLCRYDGVDFIHYTSADGLPDNRVLSIVIDDEGCIWGRTWNDVLFSYSDGKFETQSDRNSLPGGIPALHKDKDGTIWLCSEEANIYRFESGQFVPYLSAPDRVGGYIWCLFRDSRQRIWMGCTGSLYCYEDHKRTRKLTVKDGLVHDTVRAVCEDGSGRLWFGTPHGVSCYDGNTFTNYTTENGLSNDEIWDLYCDAQGRIWISTFGGGITCRDDSTFFSYNPDDGLLENSVNQVFEDHEGNYWFGHNTTGLSRFEPYCFEMITTDPVAEGGFTQDPEKRIWYGAFSKLGCVEGDQSTSITMEAPINTILDDSQGGLWVGTYGAGLFHFPDRNKVHVGSPQQFTEAHGLHDLHVGALMEDRQGRIWVGAGLNIYRYDGAIFQQIFAHPAGVSTILEDRQRRIWVGCWMGGGLVCRTDEGVRIYTTDDGLPADAVRWIMESRDGTLWICTFSGGIVRYDGEHFIAYSFAQGMWNAMSSYAYEDRAGHVWFGTEGGGVQRYDGRNFQILTRQDGLPSSTVTAITQQDDDTIVFATKRGIAGYPIKEGPPPPVFIRRVIADQAYTAPDHLNLTTVTADRVVFQFRGLSYKTNKMRYNYRLDSYDNDWQTTWEEYAVYEHIPPGEYRFQVVAIDRDLRYSDMPAMVILSVQPDPRDERIHVLQTEVELLRRAIGRKYEFDNIIGKSTAMQQVYALMEKAIDAGLTVLIFGDTGTGKELVAKAIHYHSPRKDRPIQELNCGAMPKELIAATLFGYRKGAFTGAYEDTPGLFEAADGGTILLDEIGEMSMEAQVHLLRVLQEQTIQRVGETKLRQVDVRVIAATNRDMEEEIRKGHFREDLYYRLSVFPIRLPALRERDDDLMLLLGHFLESAAQRFGKALSEPAPDVMPMLKRYPWPGNVRELENEVFRAAALADDGESLQQHHFSARITQGDTLLQDLAAEQEGYTEAVNRFRKQYVEHILGECNGNRSETAKRLKMHRPNLIALLKKFDIE